MDSSMSSMSKLGENTIELTKEINIGSNFLGIFSRELLLIKKKLAKRDKIDLRKKRKGGYRKKKK